MIDKTKLTEEEIKIKQEQVDTLELQKELLNSTVKALENDIALQNPIKELKLKILQIRPQLKQIEQNLIVLKKQVKTGKA